MDLSMQPGAYGSVKVLLGSLWSVDKRGDSTLYTIGNPPDLRPLLEVIGSGGDRNPQIDRLRDHPGLFAAVIETPGAVVGIVDRIRSIPLFFTRRGDVTDDPSSLPDDDRNEVSEQSLLELAAGGYVIGADTVLRGVHQLRAGEAVYVGDGQIETKRYYRYMPTLGENVGVELVAETLDAVFDDLVTRAEGRPISVPLSGGWDSRLVLSHLAARRYPQLTSFTYGVRDSVEARVARRVASALGVPWIHIPSVRPKDARRAFASHGRKRYWHRAWSWCSIPVMTDYLAIEHLSKEVGIPADSIIVNGQTGDFITGGHIPQALTQPNASVEDLVAAILDKHFGLWRGFKTGASRQHLAQRVRTSLEDDYGDPSGSRLPAAYETFEYSERQAKYVVNGQRLYEFFGFGWELPLWDGRFVDLWERASIADKLGQELFLDYLRSWDHAGVFTSIPRSIWRWPTKLSWVVPVGRVIGTVRGRAAKDSFYERMSFFGRYRDQWTMYEQADFVRNHQAIRNVASLYGRTLFEEMDLPWPDPAQTEKSQ